MRHTDYGVKLARLSSCSLCQHHHIILKQGNTSVSKRHTAMSQPDLGCFNPEKSPGVGQKGPVQGPKLHNSSAQVFNITASHDGTET